LGFITGSQPVAITYASGGKQLIYVFAYASYMGNPHLVVNYWDGSNWHWADQSLSLPAGVESSGYGLTAITYASPIGGQQMIDVFISGNGYLLINSWDGFKWTWAEHPVPATIPNFDPLTAITYQQSFIQREYVFGWTGNHHLIVHYTLDGINWSWEDQNQNLPQGVSGVSSPAAITFASGGQQLIYVFATADNGHLVVNYTLDGIHWFWADQGLPPSPAGTLLVWFPTAITYASGGKQLIYVFAGASNAAGTTDLVVNYWDGSQWHWADQGIPSQFTWQCILPNPSPFASSAITFPTLGSWVPQILVFAEGSSYCGSSGTPWLVLNYWNGIGWYWEIQGNM
jgi:hypothetical protein